MPNKTRDSQRAMALHDMAAEYYAEASAAKSAGRRRVRFRAMCIALDLETAAAGLEPDRRIAAVYRLSGARVAAEARIWEDAYDLANGCVDERLGQGGHREALSILRRAADALERAHVRHYGFSMHEAVTTRRTTGAT